ncbi:hypothetical protein ABK040_000018 [Willaertia magna]
MNDEILLCISVLERLQSNTTCIWEQFIIFYNQFLSSNAKHCVNIESKLSKEFHKLFCVVSNNTELLNGDLSETTETFQENLKTLQKLYKILYRNLIFQLKTEIFPGFMNSDIYQQFLYSKFIAMSATTATTKSNNSEENNNKQSTIKTTKATKAINTTTKDQQQRTVEEEFNLSPQQKVLLTEEVSLEELFKDNHLKNYLKIFKRKHLKNLSDIQTFTTEELLNFGIQKEHVRELQRIVKVHTVKLSENIKRDCNNNKLRKRQANICQSTRTTTHETILNDIFQDTKARYTDKYNLLGENEVSTLNKSKDDFFDEIHSNSEGLVFYSLEREITKSRRLEENDKYDALVIVRMEGDGRAILHREDSYEVLFDGENDFNVLDSQSSFVIDCEGQPLILIYGDVTIVYRNRFTI